MLHCLVLVIITLIVYNMYKIHLLGLHAKQHIEPALKHYCNHYTGYDQVKKYHVQSMFKAYRE